MSYDPRKIEQKWKEQWERDHVYKVSNDTDRPKYYVLDMFPYPSGAGLHVGHPLGYIASDIYARYKRLKGFNVLHPMGFDAFGLPAEEYALQTGIHPAVSTRDNMQRYREQLANLGFSFDWSREVATCDSQVLQVDPVDLHRIVRSLLRPGGETAQPISRLKKFLPVRVTVVFLRPPARSRFSVQRIGRPWTGRNSKKY